MWSPQPRQSDECQLVFCEGRAPYFRHCPQICLIEGFACFSWQPGLTRSDWSVSCSIKSVTHDFASSIYFHPNYCDTSSVRIPLRRVRLFWPGCWMVYLPTRPLQRYLYHSGHRDLSSSVGDSPCPMLLHYAVADLNGRPHCHGR